MARPLEPLWGRAASEVPQGPPLIPIKAAGSTRPLGWAAANRVGTVAVRSSPREDQEQPRS